VGRNYSSTCVAVQVAVELSPAATTLTVSSTAGFPAAPFTIVADPGTASEEIITVAAIAGNDFTGLTRGEDGTSGTTHLVGATIRHMATARDLQEPQDHIDGTTGVHGAVGSVVGTSDAQTLTNKTIDASANTVSNVAQASVTGLVTALSDATTHYGLTAGVHGRTGTLVATSDTQTLTNKTMSGASNTFSSIPQSAVTNLTTTIAAIGSASSYTPTLTYITLGTGGNKYGWYDELPGGWVVGGFLLLFGTGCAITDIAVVSLPVTAWEPYSGVLQINVGSWIFRDLSSGPDHYSGSLGTWDTSSNSVSLGGCWNSASGVPDTRVTTNRPVTVQSGDIISGQFSYRSA